MRAISWAFVLFAALTGDAAAQEQRDSLEGSCAKPFNSMPRGELSWDRVRNNLEAEWQRFGYRTVDYTGGRCSVSKRGRIEDDDIGAIEDVLKYWRAVGTAADDRHVRCEKAPWSAAFISWVFVESGATVERGDGQGQFCPDDGHATYVWHMARQQRLRTQGLPFLVYDAAKASPAVGDLICANRLSSDFRYGNYLEPKNRSQTKGKPMSAHCDVVVSKDANSERAIGGTVQDGVAMSIVPLDSRGLLVGTPGWRDWKVVVRPPFAGAITAMKMPAGWKADASRGQCYHDRRLVADDRLHPNERCELRDPDPNR